MIMKYWRVKPAKKGHGDVEQICSSNFVPFPMFSASIHLI